MKDSVIVITGAGSGIGLATALRFAKERTRLHLADVKSAEEAAMQCARLGSNVSHYQVDCRDAAAMQQLADDVFAKEGRIDVWHNNAGVGYGGRIQDMTLEDWRWVIDTNLWGVIHGTHAVLPIMLKQKSGHIINTASVLGLYAIPGAGAYCASKHAVVALSESLGAEVARQGVRVSAICPGLVATNIVADGRLTNKKLSRETLVKTWATRGVHPDRIAKDVFAIAKRGLTGTRVSAGTGTILKWLKTVTPAVYRLTLRELARQT